GAEFIYVKVFQLPLLINSPPQIIDPVTSPEPLFLSFPTRAYINPLTLPLPDIVISLSRLTIAGYLSTAVKFPLPEIVTEPVAIILPVTFPDPEYLKFPFTHKTPPGITVL